MRIQVISWSRLVAVGRDKRERRGEVIEREAGRQAERERESESRLTIYLSADCLVTNLQLAQISPSSLFSFSSFSSTLRVFFPS